MCDHVQTQLPLLAFWPTLKVESNRFNTHQYLTNEQFFSKCLLLRVSILRCNYLVKFNHNLLYLWPIHSLKPGITGRRVSHNILIKYSDTHIVCTHLTEL